MKRMPNLLSTLVQREKDGSIPFPTRKYQIIYADPPWLYKDKLGKKGADHHYKTTDNEILMQLPVQSLADENCTLFMWVTMPLLDTCFELMAAWGFRYKTNAFTWVKCYKGTSNWYVGMGSWTRANAELCLLGTRGKPKRVNNSVVSVVSSPVMGHSSKPPVIRDRIVILMGDLPRIELFARQKTHGWDAWGDEVYT